MHVHSRRCPDCSRLCQTLVAAEWLVGIWQLIAELAKCAQQGCAWWTALAGLGPSCSKPVQEYQHVMYSSRGITAFCFLMGLHVGATWRSDSKLCRLSKAKNKAQCHWLHKLGAECNTT